MTHSLRSSISAGEGASGYQPGVSADPCRRKAVAGPVPAEERRSGDDRRETRQRGVVERAAMVFRGRTSLVPVINSSDRGLTIETAQLPEIGETVRIAFSGQAPANGVVRWVAEGRVGLVIDPIRC